MSQKTYKDGDLITQLTEDQILERFKSLAVQMPELGDYDHVERIALLLNDIGCQDKILEMVDYGINDLWLPMVQECQPSTLGPSVSDQFHKKQSSFLSNSFTINDGTRWPTRHMNLAARAIEHPNIPKSLKFQQWLGSGGFGEVAEVRCTNGKAYALKRIVRETNNRKAQEQMKYITMELQILRRIRHGHYIQLVGSYTEKRHIGILMYPVADSNLEDYLENFKAGSSDESTLAGFFGCLTTALHELHYVFKIRHKDIKPQNILVHDKNILFTDFGMALDWSESGRTTTSQEKQRSPIYCAPEVAHGRDRNSKSDIWSLGCVFLEMATVLKGRPRSFVRDTLSGSGSKEYWDNAQGIQDVIKKLRSDVSDWGNEPLTWVESMLQKNKEDRPTSRMIWEMIHQASGDGKRTFFGFCCTTALLFGGNTDEGEGPPDLDMTTLKTSEESRKDLVSVVTVSSNQPQRAKVLNPSTGTLGEIQLMRNPRPSQNWVSPDMVMRFNLEVREEKDVSILVYGDIRMESRKWVTIQWMESDAVASQKGDFLVAPGAVPFQMLLAEPFLT
jgi:serine/threonine protein kinase